MTLDVDQTDLSQLVQDRMQSLISAINDWHASELGLPQLRAIVVLGEHPDLAIGAVGKRLGIGLPASSTLIDGLVHKGLVVRRQSRDDRRVALCTLTDAGQTLYHLALRRKNALREWLRAMEPEDLSALAQGIAALTQIAQNNKEEK